MAAGVLGNCARPAGGNLLGRPSAHDREGSGALIGGLKAHTELKLEIVGTPAHAAGGPLQRPAQSLPANPFRASR